MAVSPPAARSQIHFDIATARRILAYLNHRIAKIRTTLKIVESGMKHAQRLTIQGLKLIAPQSLVKPNGLKQPFGRGIEILAQKRRNATTDAPLGVKAGREWRHRGVVVLWPGIKVNRKAAEFRSEILYKKQRCGVYWLV